MITAFRLHLLRRSAWLALAAMLWLSLVPTVSQAVAAVQGPQPWTQICSASGFKAAPGSPSEAADHLMAHCPFCALSQLGHALPPAPPVAVFLPDERAHELPRLFLQAPHTLHAWRHALSRGPPSFA
ncbi:MAG: DUF2946 domain-containing protein [Aquincola tertiaricarbonis]|uniref:DUF2946 domain-containing protein n=1 Tax=Aquincola TaxID=391952 RepID=UPI000696C74C|nr:MULTISPECIES: DUF2946 domain-containing protein [Aquincola]MCR5866602.1 DUF2946 domain-containing protein [Aquincola sp. J276]